jgi:hypothetical protein
MTANATWRPHDTHGKLSEARERDLPDSAFAFPAQRRLPLTDVGGIRDAIAGFSAVEDVADADRDLAFENIRRAAVHYRVSLKETDWRQLKRRPPGHDYERPSR